MSIFLAILEQSSICTALLIRAASFGTLCFSNDRNLTIGSYTHIQLIKFGCCKVTIVDNLIHAHTCWDWECQWQRYLEWAIQRYQGSHPSCLVRVVG